MKFSETFGGLKIQTLQIHRLEKRWYHRWWKLCTGVVASSSNKGFLFSRERSSSNIIFMKPAVRLGRWWGSKSWKKRMMMIFATILSILIPPPWRHQSWMKYSFSKRQWQTFAIFNLNSQQKTTSAWINDYHLINLGHLLDTSFHHINQVLEWRK